MEIHIPDRYRDGSVLILIHLYGLSYFIFFVISFLFTISRHDQQSTVCHFLQRGSATLGPLQPGLSNFEDIFWETTQHTGKG
jgi:hypothetical protein